MERALGLSQCPGGRADGGGVDGEKDTDPRLEQQGLVTFVRSEA